MQAQQVEQNQGQKQDKIILGDEELAKQQRSFAFKYVKLMGKQLFQGKNIMKTSLPVVKYISDYRAQTQVLPEHFLLFEKVQNLIQQNEESKIIQSFFDYYFNLIINIIRIQEKPFNPMMCETFNQEYFVDGLKIKIYGEQIENHPPTTLYKLIFRDQQNWCTIQSKSSLEADVHMSAITVIRTGWNIMQLSSGYTFVFNIPEFDVKNFMFGQRYGLFKNQSKIYWSNKIEQLNLFIISEDKLAETYQKVVLSYGPNKEQKQKNLDYIYGFNNIIKIEGNIVQQPIYITYQQKKLQDIFINYKIQSIESYQKQQEIIQSDSRTRKDIQSYKNGDEEKATQLKMEYEERQRRDRKLRHSE